MSATAQPPIWQTSLNPALVRRLHREPGIVPRTLARRILGWVEYFARRTGSFADILRQRGRVGALRAGDVPIVHARWSTEPEIVWPAEAVAPATVVIRASLSIRGEAGPPLVGAAPAGGDASRVPIAQARPMADSAPPRIGSAPAATPHASPRPAVTPVVEARRQPPPGMSDPRVTRPEPADHPGRRARVRGAESVDATVIRLPPARRVARSAPRAVPALEGGGAATPAGPAERQSLRSVTPGGPEQPSPRIVPASGPAPLSARPQAASPAAAAVPPAPISVSTAEARIVMTHRSTTERVVVHTRRVSGERPPAVHARQAGSSLHGTASASRVATVRPAAVEASSPAPSRAILVHAVGASPGEAPRAATPSAVGAPRPTRSPRASAVEGVPAARPAPVIVPEGPPPVGAPRRELDIDALVEKVERRLLKNLAVERERQGGAR